MSAISIRRAEARDLSALLDIYNHYVLNTPISFDVEPRTLSQRQEWLDQFSAQGRYQCFVATVGRNAIGWSCSTKLKDRAAYATSVEASVYCAPGFTRRGTGRRLYKILFESLHGEDIHRVYAGITLPNEASVKLHTAFDFRHIGTQQEVGFKFGRYWDVALYERTMA